ncbi:MAG: IS6 family transposase [Acidobacteria bacterium]|nr:IS6 family transposase [Acidobacteriota bacterium]
MELFGKLAIVALGAGLLYAGVRLTMLAFRLWRLGLAARGILAAVLSATLVQIGRMDEDRGMARLAPVEELFGGRHFDAEIVALCVRWYLSFKLSYRDLVSMMSERSIAMAHTTIMRWVQRYAPGFEKRWKRYARPVGDSWRMDESYVKVRSNGMYLYGALVQNLG